MGAHAMTPPVHRQGALGLLVPYKFSIGNNSFQALKSLENEAKIKNSELGLLRRVSCGRAPTVLLLLPLTVLYSLTPAI